MPTEPRRRDADRSRAALLDVAERQFSDHGFDGVSLQEIGAAAGLSRGTPSYFFGNKEGLYGAVLDRVFAGRDEATRAAFAPLTAWAEDRDGDEAGLRRALGRAVTDYLAFLVDRPAFVRLIGWEDLGGGARLRDARPTASLDHGRRLHRGPPRRAPSRHCAVRPSTTRSCSSSR